MMGLHWKLIAVHWSPLKLSGLGLFQQLDPQIESLQNVRLDSLEEATLEWNPSCSMCKDEFADPQGGGDQLVIPLPCAHHYHVDCIIHWLETSHLCPLCRYALPTVEEGEPSNS
ncbi:hypothetical protein M0R45_033622 [Rubus argutus]|uniref:RING-type E3 ubiquitin transferase n=1 Tax=Rubus argutus TaxID=59490 RepID=A0AAW1WMV5_RUBAR